MRRSIEGRIIFYIPVLISAVVASILFIREWVKGDIQGRLVPATVIFMVPVGVCLVAWVIWLTTNDKRRY